MYYNLILSVELTTFKTPYLDVLSMGSISELGQIIITIPASRNQDRQTECRRDQIKGSTIDKDLVEQLDTYLLSVRRTNAL